MPGGWIVFVCSCGTVLRVPADAPAVYCWHCQRRWPRNPRMHPVQYATRSFPKPKHITWPERGKYTPNPQPIHYAPPTPPPTILPTPARTIQAPLTPVPQQIPQPLPAVTPAVKPASIGSILFWCAFLLVTIGFLVAMLTNPRGFLEGIKTLVSGGGTSGTTSSSVCAKYNETFTGDYAQCSSTASGGTGVVTRPGYQYCIAEYKSGGLTQGWIPNECIH